jgi:polysaccharide chain length determinant protein (PEP-CTERM system associated)
MSNKNEIQKFYYLVLRKRWFVMISFCVAMIAGIYVALISPPIYQASTLILVEPQRVPSDYVKTIVSSDLESRVSTIQQQILSRSNLEKIIKEFRLFSEPKHQKMFMEDKIENLRKNIQVQVTKSESTSEAFSVSFKGRNPQTVKTIANTLAAIFIDENLKIREAQAAGTSDFLDGELDEMRERLEQVEASLRAYRKRNMGELPEQLESNLKILTTLQVQLEERKDRLRTERNRLLILESEIEESKNLLATTGSTVESDLGGAPTPEQLRAQLAELKSNYTDRHPDVIKLKSRIDDLEAKYRSGELESSKTAPFSANTSGSQIPKIIPNTLRVKILQQSEIKTEIYDLEEDIANINQQIKDYQLRVERTPKREEELMSLRRDYDNIQLSYSSLLNRKLEAEIAVDMEKKQKAEQFRILDYARVPQRPVSPDMKRLLLLSVVAGLGIGFGLIFLLDFFDTSLKDPNELEPDLGVSVLATIPRIYRRGDKIWLSLNKVMSVFSIAIALTLFAGFALLALKGIDPTMEILRNLVKMKSI